MTATSLSDRENLRWLRGVSGYGDRSTKVMTDCYDAIRPVCDRMPVLLHAVSALGRQMPLAGSLFLRWQGTSAEAPSAIVALQQKVRNRASRIGRSMSAMGREQASKEMPSP